MSKFVAHFLDAFYVFDAENKEAAFEKAREFIDYDYWFRMRWEYSPLLFDITVVELHERDGGLTNGTLDNDGFYDRSISP
jgi:hypothetical protein